ncbi:MAG: hypothetical protein WCH61_09985, partial [bacterium]
LSAQSELEGNLRQRIFLYRLLFVLYAEGRLLLPVEPKSQRYYRDLSLSRLLNPLRHFSEYDNDFRTQKVRWHFILNAGF